jgi:RNA polymerase sigma factor (sigma-70 family)
MSLNAPVRNSSTELIDLLRARSEPEEDWLADALRRLPARQCLVVRLRYYGGLTQSEIAAIIGRSQMQVSRIERAALSALRDSVAD